MSGPSLPERIEAIADRMASGKLKESLLDIMRDVEAIVDDSVGGCADCSDYQDDILALKDELEEIQSDPDLLVDVKKSIRTGDTEIAINLIDRMLPAEMRHA